jgi:hypothetical protein
MADVREWCRKKGIPPRLVAAFEAYIRQHYAYLFFKTTPSATTDLLINSLSVEFIDTAWVNFVYEMKKTIEEMGSHVFDVFD